MGETIGRAHVALHTVRVLVVEDDGIFARTLERLLRARTRDSGLTIEIETVETYEDAIAARGFHLALIDLYLAPVHDERTDGVAVLAKTRARRSLRHCPVIVMTAASIDRVAGRCVILRAAAIHKDPMRTLINCAMQRIEKLARQPRTAADEMRGFALALAEDARLSDAETDVLVRITLGESYDEIAAARDTTVDTVRDHAKAIRKALAALGVPMGRDLRASVLAELIRDRDIYDE